MAKFLKLDGLTTIFSEVKKYVTSTLSSYVSKSTADSTYAKVSSLSSYATTEAVDKKIADLVGGAPETLDTLKEIADALGNDANMSATLTEQIGKKADKATTLAGYGITDAKIANGVITLGSSTITPITSHQSLTAYVKTTEMNTALAAKVDTSTYTTGLAAKANAADVYTKTTADSTFAKKTDLPEIEEISATEISAAAAEVFDAA